MSSSRPPRLKDAPSGIVGEVPSRIRTPSPTRKDSPSQPPTGLRSPSPTREVAPAPGRGRIPALAVRVMIAVGHLNGVDCLHLLRVNRELRSMGQSEAFWKSFLPYSLVERAKGDMSLLQRDFVVVALPLALAERVAKAIVVVRAAGDAAPKFPEDVALLLKKQQPVDPYFVKALVLATYLRYGELGEMGHERVIYMGHDFLTDVVPRDALAAMAPSSMQWQNRQMEQASVRSQLQALALYRRFVSIHLQAPLRDVRDMSSLHANFFNNVCSSSIHWQQMIFHKPQQRVVQHGHLLSAMLHSDGMQESKLNDLVARYFGSSENQNITSLLFGDDTPLRVLACASDVNDCFKKLVMRKTSQWSASDVLWLLENFTAFSAFTPDAMDILRAIDPRMLIMQALRCGRVFDKVALCVLAMPINLNFAERDGRGPMPIAVASAEDLPVIAALRAQGKVVVDWNFANAAGQTALFFQTAPACVAYLVNVCGLSVNHVSRAGVTPVYLWVCRRLEAILDRSSRDFHFLQLQEILVKHADWAPSGHDLVLRVMDNYLMALAPDDFSDLFGSLYACRAPISADLIALLLHHCISENYNLVFWLSLTTQAHLLRGFTKDGSHWPALPPVERLSVTDARFAAAFRDMPVAAAAHGLAQHHVLANSPLIDMAGLTWQHVEKHILPKWH